MICGCQQSLAPLDQLLPDRCPTLAELPLLRDVLGLAFRRLNLHRRPRLPARLQNHPAEVVGSGAHVEDADIPRQLEGIGDQLTGDQRCQPERVLVQIYLLT